MKLKKRILLKNSVQLSFPLPGGLGRGFLFICLSFYIFIKDVSISLPMVKTIRMSFDDSVFFKLEKVKKRLGLTWNSLLEKAAEVLNDEKES